MIRPHRRPQVVLGVLLAAALGGQSALAPAAGTKTIRVKENAFSPKRVTIAKNTLVTWRWASGAGGHDITSRGKKRFRSAAVKAGGTHRYRFRKAGTYRYVCTLHEDDGMTGRIVVR